MDAHKIKGRELADRGRVVREADGGWVVFSLTSANKYRVTLYPVFCSCPDFELRQASCKHVIAVRSVLSREHANLPLPPAPETEPTHYPRKSYPQRWPEYNAAQCNEKAEFLLLLSDLCRGIKEPEREPGRGRPPNALADLAFAACYKVYSGFSGRRFMTDMRDAHTAGHTGAAVPYNSISRFLESEVATPILRDMVTWSSLPLAALERDFAVDSSGFSACRFDRWYDAKYGRMHAEHAWVKAHIMTGTLTNVITAVEIRDKDAFDSPLLPPLVKATAVGFKLEQVSGDKAYGTLENYDVIAAAGATPYIAFKSTATGYSGGLWERMYHMFCLEKEAFLHCYHRRSNVESTFSMVKRKFGDFVRSKGDVAMKNEVLAKFVCHNVCCCIQSAYEFGTVPDFFESKPAVDPKILKFPGF